LWVPVALLLAASALGERWPSGSVGLLLASGGLLFPYLARRACPDRRLAFVVAASYGLRAAVAIAFFVASANELPILRSLQLGDGFWKFAPDARGYHLHALVVLADGFCSGWMFGHTAVDLFGGLVGSLYWWFAPHPLVAITFNVWAATATTLLAFAVARSIGGSDGVGLASAVAVGFWPSAFVWSTQLLREPLFFLLLFLVFVLVGRLASDGTRSLRSTAMILAGVFWATVLLAKFRSYSGWILFGGFMAAAAIVGVAARPRHWRRVVGCAAFMGVAVWAGVALPLWLPVPSTLWAQARGEGPSALCGPQAPDRWAILRPAFPSLSLKALAAVRRGYARSGGNLTETARLDISSPVALVRQVPSTLAIAFFAPFPSRLFQPGDTGVFRVLAATEVVLLALLLPALVAGSMAIGGTRSLVGAFMLTYGVLIWFLVALVVANEGTLFRLRLQGVLPLLVVSIAGGGLELYRRVAKRPGRRRGATRET